MKLLKTSNFFFYYNVFIFLSIIGLTFIEFPYFWPDVFKAVCCRFVVCGKWLKGYYLKENAILNWFDCFLKTEDIKWRGCRQKSFDNINNMSKAKSDQNSCFKISIFQTFSFFARHFKADSENIQSVKVMKSDKK